MRKTLTAEKKRAENRRWTWAIFCAVLAAQIAGAYYFLYLKGYILSDALSRTANAYYVLNIHPPKLASIGLVWNPLPSLLQLPLLLFKDWWRPLASHGVAGGLVTAVFASANAAFLFRCFKRYALKTSVGIVLVALFVFNPFMFYYGSNGMSEMPFFTAIIVAVASLCSWMEKRSTHDLIIIAFMLVMGFLCRYEALAIALGLAISLVIIVFCAEDALSPFKEKKLKMKLEYTTATGIVLFLPLAFAILVWIMLNWTIMGEPFYFLSSSYSNTAQTEYVLDPQFIDAMASPLNTLRFVLVKMLPFLPPFLVITVERALTKRLLRTDYWVLATMLGAITVFHFAMLITGRSYGWLRFYSYGLPICAAWLPYELSQLKGSVKKASVLAFCAAFIVSSFVVASYFNSQVHAPEEYEAFVQNDVSGIAVQNAVAARINESYYDGVLLMDSFTTSALIVNLEHPENLIVNTSEEFERAVEKPWLYNARYIVLSDPSGLGSLDALNIAYPGLYDSGADWCAEREEIGGFKIFEVLH